MTLYEKKIPTTEDKYVGIEIECFTSSRNADAVFNKYKLSSYVEIGDDGSIDTTDESENSYDELFTYEIKVLSKQSELKLILHKVGLALKEMGARVNESCGLHVHLDMRNRPFINCVNKLINVQPLLLKSVPKHRIGNIYCMPVTKADREDIYRIGKYHTINTEVYDDLKTIEIRVHEGTVDTSEIYKWCVFLIKTIDGNFATAPVRTVRKLPVRLAKYIRERISYGQRV